MSALETAQRALVDLRASADYKARKKVSPPPGFARTRLGMVEAELERIIAELSPPPVPPSLFQSGRGLFVTWGFMTGDWTPEQLVARAKADGYTYLLLELDDFGNPNWLAEHKRACKAAGITAGIWETMPTVSYTADLYVAEVEGETDYRAVVLSPAPSCPHAVVTNFNALTPERVKLLAGKGYEFLVECYTGENPQATVPRQVDYATRVLGIPKPIPVFGAYGGKTLADFAEWLQLPHAVWSAESIYG